MFEISFSGIKKGEMFLSSLTTGPSHMVSSHMVPFSSPTNMDNTVISAVESSSFLIL